MVRGEGIKKYAKGIKKARPSAKVVIGPGIIGPNGGDSCGTAIVFDNAIDVKPPTPDSCCDERYDMFWDAYEIVPGRISVATCKYCIKNEVLMASAI